MNSDWKLLALALAFIGWMATDRRVSRKRLRLAGLLVVAIRGSAKVLPMIAAGISADIARIEATRIGPDSSIDVAAWGPVVGKGQVPGGGVPVGGGLVFDCDFCADWSGAGTVTGTDTTASVVTDDSLWPNQGSPNHAGTQGYTGITTASAVCSGTFPETMENVYRVGYHATGGSFGNGASSLRAMGSDNDANVYWSAPAVGSAIFFRFYLCHDITNHTGTLSPGGTHPFQAYNTDDGEHDGSDCAFDWAIHVNSQTDGKFDLYLQSTDSATSGSTTFQMNNLTKGQAYRVEFALIKYAEGPAYYHTQIRLDGEDSTAAVGATNDPLEISDYCVQSLYLGNNDNGDWRQEGGDTLSGGPYPDLDALFWGGVAVDVRDDTTDWIGPYVLGERTTP